MRTRCIVHMRRKSRTLCGVSLKGVSSKDIMWTTTTSEVNCIKCIRSIKLIEKAEDAKLTKLKFYRESNGKRHENIAWTRKKEKMLEAKNRLLANPPRSPRPD
jgi:hypothetical protein